MRKCGTIYYLKIGGNMRENLFTIGGFEVKSYGFCIALGIIAAYIVAETRTKKRKLNPDTCFDLAVWAAIGGLLGAKLMFYIVEIKNVIANPSMLLDISNGFVVYGGIIGGVISGYIACKVKKLDVMMWFDLIIAEIPLAQAFGRMGCFFAGCCYGAETDSACHVVFQNSRFAPNHIQLIPTQLISSAANLLHFLILTFVIARIFKKKPGVLTSCFLVFYSIGRFIIEFFRGDIARGSVGIFSTSQFISFFIFAIGMGLFIYFIKQPDRDPVEEYIRSISSGETEESKDEAEASTDTEETQDAEEADETEKNEQM